MAALVSAESLVREGEAGGWQSQLRESVRSVEQLAVALDLSPDELEGARRAESEGLPIAITPYYLSLCDRHDPSCPVSEALEQDVPPLVRFPTPGSFASGGTGWISPGVR